MGFEKSHRRVSKRQAARNALRAATAAFTFISNNPASKADDLGDAVRQHFVEFEREPKNKKGAPAPVNEWPLTEREHWTTPSAKDTEQLTTYLDLSQKMSGLHLRQGEKRVTLRQFKEFCFQFARFCEQLSHSRNQAWPTATPEFVSSLAAIHNEVNTTIKPQRDLVTYGTNELWTIPGEFGDCEDYVLLKIKKLLEKGFDPAHLHILIVSDENNEGHAVLGVDVRDQKGALNTLVLDNKQKVIMTLSEMETTFRYRGMYASFISTSVEGSLRAQFFSYSTGSDTERSANKR